MNFKEVLYDPIFNNKPIQGSCGGIGADESCTICGGDTEKCDSIEAV